MWAIVIKQVLNIMIIFGQLVKYLEYLCPGDQGAVLHPAAHKGAARLHRQEPRAPIQRDAEDQDHCPVRVRAGLSCHKDRRFY